MMGLYPKGSAEDPDTYAAGVSTILASYPVDVVRKVCSPWGIAARVKWLPSIYEVKEACEIAMGPYYADASNKIAEGEKQLKQNEDFCRYGPDGPPSEEQMAENRKRVDAILATFKDKIKPYLEEKRKNPNSMTKEQAEARLATIKPVTLDDVGNDLRAWIDRCIDASGAR